MLKKLKLHTLHRLECKQIPERCKFIRQENKITLNSEIFTTRYIVLY